MITHRSAMSYPYPFRDNSSGGSVVGTSSALVISTAGANQFKAVILSADARNTDNIWIGIASTAVVGNGICLPPGATVFFPVRDNISAISTAASQQLGFVELN